MEREEQLNELFDDLEANAYIHEYHTYHYKETNQIIRKHFEKLFTPQSDVNIDYQNLEGK